jgi:hypothetical protein
MVSVEARLSVLPTGLRNAGTLLAARSILVASCLLIIYLIIKCTGSIPDSLLSSLARSIP